MSPRGLVLLVVAVAACAPDTDLVGESPRRPSSGPLAPSGILLIEPAAGASDVPPNLAAVVVRFASPVSLVPGSLQLCRSARGDDLLSSATMPVVCPALGFCYRLSVDTVLPSGATCQVAVRPGLVAEDGGPVAAGVVGQFDTAAIPDLEPPQISGLTVQPAGSCLGVHFATDEPSAAAVLIAVGEHQTVTSAGVGATTFDLAVTLTDLPADADAAVRVRAVDRAGNAAETPPVPLHTPPPLPPLMITEVLANPAGREPDQEFIELKNLGPDPVDLAGMRIEDSRGGDVLPAASLGPGAYALIVGTAWDPVSAMDTVPRGAPTVVRVDARLGADGLSNAGERITLRAAATGEAAVISSYGGWVDVSAAGWSGKAVHRLSEHACDHPASWNRTPLPATPGWGAP